MLSWTLNAVKLKKNNNRITLKEPAEDLHAHVSTQISWPSKSNICQNFYASSWILNAVNNN